MNEPTIDRKAWHYKWWKICQGREKEFSWGSPINVSICSYCQRIFWMSLLYLFFASWVLSMIGLWIYGLCTKTAVVAPASIIAIAAIGLIVWLSIRKPSTNPPGVVRSWLQAKKDKVCPLVKFQ